MQEKRDESVEYDSIDEVLEGLEGFAEKCTRAPERLTEKEMVAFGLLLREVGTVELGDLREEQTPTKGFFSARRFSRRWPRRSRRFGAIAAAALVLIALGVGLWRGIDLWSRQPGALPGVEDLSGSLPGGGSEAGVRFAQLEVVLSQREDELAHTFFSDFELQLSPSQPVDFSDGDLFLDFVKSQAISDEVRGHAAWALRFFEDTWHELGIILDSDRSPEFLLGVILGIPTDSINLVPGVVLDVLMQLVETGSTNLRRQAAARLGGYLDADGALFHVGSLFLERVAVEGDVETLGNLMKAHSLEQVLLAGSSVPSWLVEIAKGTANGDWTTPVGRRVRALSFGLLAKVGHPEAIEVLLGLANSERSHWWECVFVLLHEPALLRPFLDRRREETYGVFRELVRIGNEEDRFPIEKLLLNADGAGAFRGLADSNGVGFGSDFPIAQLLTCEELLFSESDGRSEFESYLLERLRRWKGRDAEELYGLCRLLGRFGSERVWIELRNASRRSDLERLARLQIRLALLQTSLEEDPDSFLSELREGLLADRAGDEIGLAVGVLGMLVSTSSALRTPEFADLLVAVLDESFSAAPALPFLVVPELYRLSEEGVGVGRDLEVLSAPFLTHPDWRVRLATAIARFDGGDGDSDEIDVAFASAPSQWIRGAGADSKVSGPSGLRDRLAEIRLFSLLRAETGEASIVAATSRRSRYSSRLEEGLKRMREARREIVRVLRDGASTADSGGIEEDSVLALAARLGSEELERLRKGSGKSVDPEWFRTRGNFNLSDRLERSELMMALEVRIEEWLRSSGDG